MENKVCEAGKRGRQEHPEPGALQRFLAGKATRAERREIVRHLLAGCRECRKVTRPLWLLADADLWE